MSVLELGYVPWSPIVWIIAIAVVTALAYLFRSQGQKKYKKDTAQTSIFLCGEEVPDAERRHIRAHNIYWGFFETLKGYYDRIIKPHTGIINDYIFLFIVVVAITALILFIAGPA
jgi:Na+/H+ antiporter NhaC